MSIRCVLTDVKREREEQHRARSPTGVRRRRPRGRAGRRHRATTNNRRETLSHFLRCCYLCSDRTNLSRLFDEINSETDPKETDRTHFYLKPVKTRNPPSVRRWLSSNRTFSSQVGHVSEQSSAHFSHSAQSQKKRHIYPFVYLCIYLRI